VQAVELAIHHFGVYNLVTFLKSTNGSHKVCES